MINEKWTKPGSPNFQRIPHETDAIPNTPRESALHVIRVIDGLKEHVTLYWALIKLIDKQDKSNDNG